MASQNFLDGEFLVCTFWHCTLFTVFALTNYVSIIPKVHLKALVFLYAFAESVD